MRRPGDEVGRSEPEAQLASPNARNFKGESPLDIAVRMRYVSSVALLLQGGADPNVLDADGDTPLAKAEYDQINFGGWAISTLLKDHGALALIPEDPYDERSLDRALEVLYRRASDRGLDDDVGGPCSSRFSRRRGGGGTIRSGSKVAYLFCSR